MHVFQDGHVVVSQSDDFLVVDQEPIVDSWVSDVMNQRCHYNRNVIQVRNLAQDIRVEEEEEHRTHDVSCMFVTVVGVGVVPRLDRFEVRLRCRVGDSVAFLRFY